MAVKINSRNKVAQIIHQQRPLFMIYNGEDITRIDALAYDDNGDVVGYIGAFPILASVDVDRFDEYCNTHHLFYFIEQTDKGYCIDGESAQGTLKNILYNWHFDREVSPMDDVVIESIQEIARNARCPIINTDQILDFMWGEWITPYYFYKKDANNGTEE